jgi:hypothetical protein
VPDVLKSAQQTPAFHAACSTQFSNWLQLEAANLMCRNLRASLTAQSNGAEQECMDINGRFAQQRASQHNVVDRLASVLRIRHKKISEDTWQNGQSIPSP